jgi:hypothetical protein
MSTIIPLNESKLMDFYEKIMDEVYLIYHTHPTNIPHMPISDEERAEMSYYEAMARDVETQFAANRLTKSKKVIFHKNPNYCNGKLRRR